MPLTLYDYEAIESLLRVQAKQTNILDSIGTSQSYGLSEKQTRKATRDIHKELLAWQEKLFAEKKQSLLIVGSDSLTLCL